MDKGSPLHPSLADLLAVPSQATFRASENCGKKLPFRVKIIADLLA